MTGLRPATLRLDTSPLSRPEFAFANPRMIDLEDQADRLRLRCSRGTASIARARMAEARRELASPTLTFIGSGDYHHLTLMLLESLPTPARPITLVVFDNHPDWFVLPPKYHCGNWVAGALRLPFIEQVVLIGQDSADLAWTQIYTAPLRDLNAGRLRIFPLRIDSVGVPILKPPATSATPFERNRSGSTLRFTTVASRGAGSLLDQIADSLAGRDVYVSIDKDCLSPNDAATDWEQGGLRLADVLDGVATLRATTNIVGADVCGDRASRPLTGFIKRLDAGRLRSTWSPPTSAEQQLNTAANLALLHAFTEPATIRVRTPAPSEPLAWTVPHG